MIRELDRVLVKGENQPITAFQPIARAREATDAQREMVACYAKALADYRGRRFAAAAAIWDDLVQKYEPAPSPSSVMAARAREYITNPPPPEWNGVFVMTSK